MTATPVTLQVEGMNCGHCAARIEKTLARTAGVTSAAVDLAGKRVTIEYAPETIQPAQLAQVITELGYPAS